MIVICLAADHGDALEFKLFSGRVDMTMGTSLLMYCTWCRPAFSLSWSSYMSLDLISSALPTNVTRTAAVDNDSLGN